MLVDTRLTDFSLKSIPLISKAYSNKTKTYQVLLVMLVIGPVIGRFGL